jgi:hypothetical protein
MSFAISTADGVGGGMCIEPEMNTIDAEAVGCMA